MIGDHLHAVRWIDTWIKDHWTESPVGEHDAHFDELVRSAIADGKLGSFCRFVALLAADNQLIHVGRALLAYDLDPTTDGKADSDIINPAMAETCPNRLAWSLTRGWHQTDEPNPHYKPNGGK